MKIVAFGDSVTQVTLLAPGQSVPEGYAPHLEALMKERCQKPVCVVNKGVGGNTACVGVMRFEQDVVEEKPDVVLIMFGLNDQYHRDPEPDGTLPPRNTVEAYTWNLRHMVRRARSCGIEPVLMTTNPITQRWGAFGKPPHIGEDPNLFLRPYGAAAKQVADEEGVSLVDVFEAYLAWDGCDASLQDGVHPDGNGQRFIARLIVESGVLVGFQGKG